MRRRNRLIAVLLFLIMCIGLLDNATLFSAGVVSVVYAEEGIASATDAESKNVVYEDEIIRVENVIDYAWQGGFNASITITNISGEPIENWALSMKLPYEISDIWNAAIKSHEDKTYVIQNVGWNQEISVAGSVCFGYTCSTEETDIVLPNQYCLISKAVVVKDEAFDVTFEIVDQWEGGYTANVSICNKGQDAIAGWQLQFLSSDIITDIWNAYIEDKNDDVYFIRHASHTSYIGSGSEITFGYQAVYDGEAGISYPSSFALIRVLNGEEASTDSDRTTVEQIYANLQIGYQGRDNAFSVTNNLILPKYDNAEITWQSNNSDIISDDGVVNRPQGESKEVILTATIKKGDAELIKNFQVKVIKRDYVGYNKETILDIDSYESLYLYDDDVEVYLNEAGGRLAYIVGNYTEFIVESPDEAVLSLYGLKTLLQCQDPESEFEWVYTNEDFYCRSFCFRQIYKGIPVYGSATNIVTDLEGNVITLHTDYIPLTVDTNPTISKENAISAVGGGESIEADLCIYVSEENPVLAWQVDATNTNIRYIVDAGTGDILNQIDLELDYAQESGSGNNELGVSCTFPVEAADNDGQQVYVMEDATRNLKMYDASLASEPGQRFDCEITSATNVFSDASAVSAFDNVIFAYDYFLNNFNRKGFANDGAQIKIAVHDGKTAYNEEKSLENNAAHINGNLVFGEITTSGYICSYAAARDVAVHEYTHGVTAKLTSLSSGGNVQGAINEAYSDIMGALATGSWSFACIFTGGGCDRNLANPTNSRVACPSAVDGLNYYTEDKYSAFAHYNSTVISHACYYMYSHGISDRNKLARLWYASLSLGYGSGADYSTVRMNVLSVAKKAPFEFSESEIEIMEDAFDNANIYALFPVDITGTNTVCGRVLEADKDVNSGNNTALSDVTVTLERLNQIAEATVTTDDEGNYCFSQILPGKYIIKFEKQGYESETLYYTVSSTRLYNYCPAVELFPRDFASKKGNANGTVKDAVTGEGVEGLSLYVRKGISNTTGRTLFSSSENPYTYTDSDGEYELNRLASGIYCIEIVDERGVDESERYLTTYFNVKIYGGENVSNQNATVSKGLDADQLRIVLQWGQRPKDLDSHLLGTFTQNLLSRTFHVCYKAKKYSFNDTLIADLDLDDTASYGPETTTIYAPLDGQYIFYVYNYTNETDLTSSGAYVQVYMGGSNMADYTFYVPNTGNGRYWTVFSYDSTKKLITPINQIDSSAVMFAQ